MIPFDARPRAALRFGIALSLICAVTGCGLITGSDGQPVQTGVDSFAEMDAERGSTIWDLFNNDADPNTTLEVNRYLWNASLDVLSFLPVQTVDPFSGVIVTGYGRPPGGGTAYRATIYVQDPALEARSLRVALATRSGPVNADTVRAVEDAILTRARQLRLRDEAL